MPSNFTVMHLESLGRQIADFKDKLEDHELVPAHFDAAAAALDEALNFVDEAIDLLRHGA